MIYYSYNKFGDIKQKLKEKLREISNAMCMPHFPKKGRDSPCIVCCALASTTSMSMTAVWYVLLANTVCVRNSNLSLLSIG